MQPATHQNDLRNDSRDQAVIALIKSGFSYRAAAEKLGITRGTVSGICFRYGVKMDAGKVMTKAQRSQVGNAKGKALRSDRLDRAAAMREAGLSYAEIEKALGYARSPRTKPGSIVFQGIKRRRARQCL